jgi:parallel beta-helix repeat protein
MLGENDGGGIYVQVGNNATANTWDYIYNNIVYNTTGNAFQRINNYTGSQAQGNGIYLDNAPIASSYYKILNNTVAFNTQSGIYLHNSSNILVNGNTLFQNGDGNADTLSGQILLAGDLGAKMADINLTNNIYYTKNMTNLAGVNKNPYTFLLVDTVGTDNTLFGHSDYNYFYPGLGKQLVTSDFIGRFGQNAYNLSEWVTASGNDSNSVLLSTITDPQIYLNPTSNTKILVFSGYTNITGSNLGTYNLQPFTSIIYGGTGTVTETDTTPPTFTTIPNNASIIYGDNLTGINFVATDETGFGTYRVNDTRFIINSTGYLTLNQLLLVGDYLLNITINDTTGNINSTIYKVSVLGEFSGINYTTTNITVIRTNSTGWISFNNTGSTNESVNLTGLTNSILILSNGSNLITQKVNLTLQPLEGVYIWSYSAYCSSVGEVYDSDTGVCVSNTQNSARVGCNDALSAFQSYPILVGLIGTVFLIGIGLLFLYGYSVVKSGEPITAEQVGIGLVIIIGIGVAIIIGIVAISSICSVGVI